VKPALILFLSLISTLALAAGKTAASSTKWDATVDKFLDHYYEFDPPTATNDGLHQYDAKMEDRSRAGVEHEIATWKKFRGQVAGVDEKKLNAEEQIDRRMMLGYIDQRLLTLETIRPWEKDPDTYQSALSIAVFRIMSRTYASQDERLRSAIARERLMPQILNDARANLKNPPQIYTQIALQQTPDLISFFQHDVPQAFDKVTDKVLLAEFKQSNAAVIAALQSYQEWMQKDLLPRSHGDFRLGAETYSKLLLYREEVDTPLDKLLEIGMADLRRNQRSFREVAAKIDPNKTSDQLHEEMLKNHPSAEQLLPEYAALLDGLRAYVVDHKIMSIPGANKPTMQETPPFQRATTFASMDTPGAFETKATESFFNATLPEKNASPQDADSLLRGHARPVMVAVAVHEVWPGHYMQYVWQQKYPTKLRKVLSANTNVEGWAHYTEQMMLDEGYGNGDPMLRLGQLQDALLRNARFVVAIRMHTGTMTLDEAREFFVKEGMQTTAVADTETKRGTGDPLYLYYNLGKQQILKLRADYQKKMGDKFTLQDFHDTFMREGQPPIKEVRHLMLGDDSPTL
jgi:uncharacterized protein (DUF885 family)